MNIIDRIKDKFKKKEMTVIKKVNLYTGVVIYYEYNMDPNEAEVTVKIIDEVPSYAKVLDYNEFIKDVPFRGKNEVAFYNADEILEDEAEKNPYFFRMSSLYYLNTMKDSKDVKENYEKYLKLTEALKEKCKNEGIDYETDERKIYLGILKNVEDDFFEESKKMGVSSRIDLSYLENEETLNGVYNYEITHKFDSSRFAHDKRYVINYYYSFLKYLPSMLKIMDRNNLNDNEKEIIRKYTELYSILPTFISRLDSLDNLTYLVEKAKVEKTVNKLSENDEFMDDLNNLFSKTNPELEDLYIHATGSSHSANNIMNKGLYTFSDDLTSFSFPYRDFNQIFTYQYGNETNRVGDYIIIFRMPKGNHGAQRISEEEAKNVVGEIDMRRNSVVILPTHKIPASDILGIIDKKDMKVIENDKFLEFANTKKL